MTITPEPLPAPIGAPELSRMTAEEILTTYGPEVFRLVGQLQASGQMVRDGRSHFDLEITQQTRLRLIEQGADCPTDEWKEELGL